MNIKTHGHIYFNSICSFNYVSLGHGSRWHTLRHRNTSSLHFLCPPFLLLFLFLSFCPPLLLCSALPFALLFLVFYNTLCHSFLLSFLLQKLLPLPFLPLLLFILMSKLLVCIYKPLALSVTFTKLYIYIVLYISIWIGS